MQRSRLTMFLGALALALSGCLSSAAPDGAQREIDEVQRATSPDETAATDPAQVAAEAATWAPSDHTPAFEPCPCDLPICRPGCTKREIAQAEAAAEAATRAPSDNAAEIDPCPCDNPICRPACTNP